MWIQARIWQSLVSGQIVRDTLNPWVCRECGISTATMGSFVLYVRGLTVWRVIPAFRPLSVAGLPCPTCVCH